MDTWQAKWKPPRPVHRNPLLILGGADEASLRDACEKFGKVSEVFVPKGQKFAFVHFEDKYDAEKGLELNGTTIGGKQVKVTDGKCANKEVDAWRHACRDAYRASVK